MVIQKHNADCGEYYACKTEFSAEFNALLASRFGAEKENSATKKTHYFEGRYENIYIEQNKIPQLQQVLAVAILAAEEILSLEKSSIRAGFWFNEMPPGHRTIAHRHDDGDELLSAVYYINVPKDSGRLILGTGVSSSIVQPISGMLIFFPPTMVHEVEKNQSLETRLSMGINFGKIGD